MWTSGRLKGPGIRRLRLGIRGEDVRKIVFFLSGAILVFYIGTLLSSSVVFTNGGSGSAVIAGGGTGSISMTYNVAGSTNAGNVFVNDTFTAADGTALTSHTGEVGATWVQHSSYTGTFSISSNRVVTNLATGNGAYASGIPPTADYYVEGTIHVLSANYDVPGMGVAARVNTTKNSMVFLRYTSNGGGEWQCEQLDDGTASQIGTPTTQTLTVGNDYAIKLTVLGSDTTGYVNGTEVCTGTTSVVAAGRVGIRGDTASSTTGPALADIKGTSY